MRSLAILLLLVGCTANEAPTKAPRPPCTPNCVGFQCGSDGCGGTCGICDMGRSCQNGLCIDDSCRPNCTGYECGDDGCAGSCGTCRNGTCINHTCVADPCHWAGNGICDDACATSFPNHFDDTADCTSGNPCSGECAAGLDTACTCSAADPCDRVGDGVCQEGCATNFPVDHFDDAADCSGTPCAGECTAEEYTACTCAATDPCGWAADGNCDNYCVTNFPSDHFDDGADCTAGVCGGECAAEQYTECTCAVADLCSWVADGWCDDYCEINFPSDFFDDTTDCGGSGCQDDCVVERYTECSCAAADPCGWANDGLCDDYCANTFPGDYFDDTADCSGGPTCGTECTDLVYTACTCGVADPCGWAGDGACDDYCSDNFGSYFDDTADCSGSPTCGTDCTDLVYTACTCGALDVCAWVGDGYCDDYCATNFPGDYFDDSADCP